MCSSCQTKQKKNDFVPVVQADTVMVVGRQMSYEFPGRVKAAETTNLAFKVAGRLERYLVKEGSFVKKGQVVAVMDDRDYKVLLDATTAEYNDVQSKAKRVMDLYTDSVVTAEAYDKARYGLQQIKAKLDNARNQLADTKLTAPYDGYVQKCLFESGTVVGAGSPVITIISSNKSEVEINIPAVVYLQRKDLFEFSATFDVLPDVVIPLTMVSMMPKANASQLYTTRLAIPANANPQPIPGMNAVVKMSVEQADVEKMNVPATALLSKDGKTCVWVLNANQEVQLRQVEVEALHNDGSATLKSGLKSGEIVVTAGVNSLREGTKVRVLEKTSETNVGGLL
ncbi:MAG: efflux RND transporter periplasmic adaptor subunit [Bacteroidales bacterium]|nr:efflux RND transporter periplasmic adaptor subunit [Bacteroidales bacterium]